MTENKITNLGNAGSLNIGSLPCRSTQWGNLKLVGLHTSYKRHAMWFLFQALIFCAVVGSNIDWQWTPNQYVASFIGAGLAWVATHIVVQWRDRRARRKPNKNEATPGRAASSQFGRKDASYEASPTVYSREVGLLIQIKGTAEGLRDLVIAPCFRC